MERESISRLSKHVHHGARRLIQSKMEDYNIGMRQMRILFTIANVGQMNQRELYKKFNIDRAVITNSLKTLISNGYLEKVKCTTDKRLYIISTTEKGMAIIPQLKEIFDYCEDVLISKLTTQEIEQLSVLLSKVNESINEELERGCEQRKN